MPYPKNFIILRTGVSTKKGGLTRWAKVNHKKMAKIIYECIYIGKILVMSGPDKADIESSKILRDEIERLHLLTTQIPESKLNIPSEESEFLGKSYGRSEDDKEEEEKLSLYAIARIILDLVEARKAEMALDTVIIITHHKQSVEIQEKYNRDVFRDKHHLTFGGVVAGSGIWMRQTAIETARETQLLGSEPITILLHDKIPKIRVVEIKK